jgi:ABC-type sulfate transport system substrate-binding protein
VKLWTVEKELGGWTAAQRKLFDAGQVLDVIQAEVGARRMEERRAGKAPQRK